MKKENMQLQRDINLIMIDLKENGKYYWKLTKPISNLSQLENIIFLMTFSMKNINAE